MKRIAQDIKKITNDPLIVCNTGSTTISATRVILTKTEAEKLMMKVHTHGKALCGIYSLDIGITKRNAVNKYSRDNSYPLKCISEKI